MSTPPVTEPRPFEDVVRTHGPTVLRVCRAVVGPQDAGDAWSETFLSALRAYPNLPEGVNLEAWLVTIAHRRAIDVLRARGRRPVPVPDPGLVAGIATPTADGWPGAADDPAAQVLSALAGLPRKQRLVLAYHHVAGLPYREVAGIVGGTEAAARRAASDGMASLRSRLAHLNRGGSR